MASLMKRYVLVGLLAGLLSIELASAQSFFAMRRDRSLLFVGGTGTSTYFGELSNDGDYLQAKPNFNVGLQYYFTSRLGVRADITWFQLTGSDSKSDSEGRRVRNLSFSSNNYEISAVGILSLYPQGRSFYQRPAFNVYGFAGFGLCYFNPTTEYKGQKYSLAPLHTEGVNYSRVTPVIPMGLGIRLKVGPFMNLSFEGGWRKTFTDYLDDVSTVYVAQSSFSDPIAAALSQRGGELTPPYGPVAAGSIRGNSKSMDSYMLFNAKIEYYLPTNFLEKDRGQKKFKNKRKSFYRYNKRGGLKK